MKAITGQKWIGMLFFLLSSPVWASAVDGRPSISFKHYYLGAAGLMTDTVPQPVKTADKGEAKPVETVIKAVPKVRKQAIPVPVIPTVKPVKIIKPKIVKPVLKILR